MSKQGLTQTEKDRFLELAAAKKSAEFIVANIKTDSISVLHEAHRMYIAAEVAMNAHWEVLFRQYPAARSHAASIKWPEGIMSWEEGEPNE